MITEITGDTNTFRAMAYGVPDAMTIDWSRQREQMHLSSLLPAVQENYMTLQNTVFGQLDYATINNTARAINNVSDAMWLTNRIRPLNTIDEVQVAPPAMIPWLMACPEVRTKYHEQTIAGFDDYYVDSSPGLVGEDHYEYRRVIDGVFLEEGDEWVAREYIEDVLPGHDLDLYEQECILDAWDVMLDAIREGVRDPTSRFNANL